MDRVLVCFEPEEFSLAVHADFGTGILAHDCVVDVKGYLSQRENMEVRFFTRNLSNLLSVECSSANRLVGSVGKRKKWLKKKNHVFFSLKDLLCIVFE